MQDLSEKIKLARPRVLVAGFLLYLYGALASAVYGGDFPLWRIFFGYLVFLPAHLSVHYSNDYHDFEADSKADPPTPFTGGTGVLVMNPQLRPFAKRFALMLMAISIQLSILFAITYNYSWLFVVFVFLCNLLGWYYAAPPVRLSYRGFSEISTSILIGFLIPGMGWIVAMEVITLEFLLISVPMLLYGIVFIISVELPDMEGDIAGGKINLVTRRGREFSFAITGILSIMVSMYFFWIPINSEGLIANVIYSIRSTEYFAMDYQTLGVFTMPSLLAGISGLAKMPVSREEAIPVVNNILTSFILYLLFADLYFAILINR